MGQRNTVIGLLLFVIVTFGGLIYYDAKSNHKFDKLLNKEKQSQNWKWDDNWNNKPQDSPIPDKPDIIQNTPGSQIIAGSYAEAVQKSGEIGKPILIFFTAEWCQWCKKMKSETMNDNTVQSVCKNYILVYVDTDKDRASATKFGVESLPSYVVSNSKETKLKMDAGFKNANTFANWLNDPSLFQQPKSDTSPKPESPKIKPESPKNNGPIRRRREQPPQMRPKQSEPNCSPGG